MNRFDRKKKKVDDEGFRNLHIIEQLSVLVDYIKNKPKLINYIVAKPSHMNKVASLVGAIKKIPLYEVSAWCKKMKVGDTLPSAAPVWASIKVELLSEQDLASRIQHREDRDILVALDHITDPRNLGAIVRNAAFFGLREIIVPRNRQVLLTSSSIKTAQGGFSNTDLVVVTNLVRTLTHLKQKGYWIVGTAIEGVPLKEADLSFKKMVIVFGSEDNGLSLLVKKTCDVMVSISGAKNSIQSLNVSVASGILMHYSKTKI